MDARLCVPPPGQTGISRPCGKGCGLSAESSPERWSRLEKIRFLLDHWDDIFDASASGFGASSDPLGITLLPRMANHPSVKELDRCLRLLRTAAPGDYRHLMTYRCCEWRNVTEVVPRKLVNSKKREMVPQRVRRRVLPSWMPFDPRPDYVPPRVKRGEQFLADKFRGEVFIPAELWDALHTPAMAA
jgi:hypothetical protein